MVGPRVAPVMPWNHDGLRQENIGKHQGSPEGGFEWRSDRSAAGRPRGDQTPPNEQLKICSAARKLAISEAERDTKGRIGCRGSEADRVDLCVYGCGHF
jgi:hypothetical protein